MSSPTSSRRAFLRRAGSAVLAAGPVSALLGACDDDGAEASGSPLPAPAAAPDDDTLVRRALRDAKALAARYDATLRRHNGLRPRLGALQAAIHEHVEVLSGAVGEAEGSARLASPVAASRRKALRDLATAERRALRRRRRDAVAAESGELARLLASIAACHAQHLRLLAPGSAPPASPGGQSRAGAEDADAVVDALNDTLAGEHAALYAYGVIGGRLDADTPPVEAASEAWLTHQRRRADLTRLIESAGGAPVGAETGYRLPRDVRTIADARAIAQLVEDRCAVLYATLAATATGDVRALAVDALVDAATRTLAWGAPSSALPGVERP